MPETAPSSTDTAQVPHVFSPTVFGPDLARQLDALLAIKRHHAAADDGEDFPAPLRAPRGDSFHEACALVRRCWVVPGEINDALFHDTVPEAREALGSAPDLYTMHDRVMALWRATPGAS